MDTAAEVPCDLEASPVQGQTASAVLDLQGQVVSRQHLPSSDAAILFQMLVQAAKVASEDFVRMTVTFNTVRYTVTRDAHFVYLVQTRAGSS